MTQERKICHKEDVVFKLCCQITPKFHPAPYDGHCHMVSVICHMTDTVCHMLPHPLCPIPSKQKRLKAPERELFMLQGCNWETLTHVFVAKNLRHPLNRLQRG